MGAFSLRRFLHPAAVAAALPLIIPGAINSPGTHLTSAWAATSTPAAQGTSGQEGYAYPPAGVNWAHHRFGESILSGGVSNELIVGIVCMGTPDAAPYTGLPANAFMSKVEMACGGGAYVASTQMTPHPVHGRMGFWFRVRAADLVSGVSGLYELRAILTPKVGQCMVMQGPDATGATILAYQALYSSYVILDKGDLARQTIVKAPNDGTTEAAELAAVTAGTLTGASGNPCKTWKAARQIHRNHPNYPNVLTTYTLTASQNHEWGCGTAEDLPIESNLGWTKIQPVAGLTNADVAIVRWLTGVPTTSFNIPCRKFYMKDINQGDVPIYNLVGGFPISAAINPGSGDGTYNNTTLGINTSFHFHIENIITTARPTTLVTSSADQNYNQPTSGDSFDHGIHCSAVEIVNCQFQYCSNIPFYQATYVRDCTINHISNQNDMADNMRYCAGLHAYNISAWNQVNHLDFLQPTFTGPNKGCWLEDLTATTLDGNTQGGYNGFTGTMDGILCDDGHNYHNSVFLRLILHTGTGHDISMGSAMQNNRFVNCDTAGQGVIPGWQFNLNAPLSAPCNNCWFLYDSVGSGVANFEMVYRKGIKHVYPFSTRLPNPGTAIPVSPLLTALGTATRIYGVWDLDMDEFAMRVHHDDTWPSPTFYSGFTKLRGIVDANWPEAASRLNFGPDYIIGAMANQLQQATTSKRPTVIEGANRLATFDKTQSQSLKGNLPSGAQFAASIDATGKMTVTEFASKSVPLVAGVSLTYAGASGVAVGTTIASQISGTTGDVGVYQLTGAPVGNGVAYVMTTGIQRNDTLCFFLAANVKADTDTAVTYLFHGGSASTGKGYVGRQYITGQSRQQYIFEAGQAGAAGAGATYTAGQTPTGSPAIEGPSVICFEIMADRIRLTYWNAATAAASGASKTADGGWQTDVLYTSGNQPWHLFQSAYPFAIGSISGGEFGFSSFDFADLTISGLLPTGDRANTLAALKAEMGLS